MAALLNAGNNALNQIYDLEIDRVNKPKRPLPSGRLTIAQVVVVHHITYALALVLAWLVAPGGTARVLLAGRRRRRLHVPLLGAAVPHQAARHLGQRHDRDSRAACC